MLWAVQRILFNKLDKPENRALTDLNWREIGMLVPLSALMVWIGFFPSPLLRRMEPSVARIVEQVQARSKRGVEPPVAASYLPGRR
jgi:NADH-quinone oxidoreductase subunit M